MIGARIRPSPIPKAAEKKAAKNEKNNSRNKFLPSKVRSSSVN